MNQYVSIFRTNENGYNFNKRKSKFLSIILHIMDKSKLVGFIVITIFSSKQKKLWNFFQDFSQKKEMIINQNENGLIIGFLF